MVADDRADALREASETLERTTEALETLSRRVGQAEQRTAQTRTWLTVGLLVVLAVAMVLFVANRITLRQAQAQAEVDQRTQVSTCFASPGRLQPEVAAACARRWGPMFVAGQQAAAKRTAEYEQLKAEHAALVAEARRRGVPIPTTTTTTAPDPPN
jgi:uncharacterized protein YceH (UPF0502 family)